MLLKNMGIISKIITDNPKVFFQNSITQRSINQSQYDCSDLCWNPQKKGMDSPVRGLMYRNLSSYIKQSRDRAVLEIGCGTGWLLYEIGKYNPIIVEGIDPSRKNIEIVGCVFPDIKVTCSSFELFSGSKKYDSIYSIMVISHVWDIENFFRKCANFLNNKGETIIVVPDYEYFQKSRQGYVMEFVYFKDSYAVNIQQKMLSLSQIVRKNEAYHDAAKQARFLLAEEKPIVIDQELVAQNLKYNGLLGLPMFYLLRYIKNYE